jgi:DivIVA domain-containing protein
VTGEEVRACEFRSAWRGYDPDTVDRLLEDVARELDRGEPVDARRFESLRLPLRFRGYDRTDVDAFVDRIRDTAR